MCTCRTTQAIGSRNIAKWERFTMNFLRLRLMIELSIMVLMSIIHTSQYVRTSCGANGASEVC